MSKPMSMIPSLFAHAETIGIASDDVSSVAWIQVTAFPTFMHKVLYSLQNFFVKVPLKALTNEYRLVARVFFDAWNPVLKHSLGQDLQISQDLDIQILEYQGLVSQVPLCDLKQSLSWNGQSLQILPQTSSVCACLFQVQMQEPHQWPVKALPVGPKHHVVKQALGFFVKQEKTDIVVQKTVVCLGPDLKGSQHDWHAMPNGSLDSFSFLRGIANASPVDKSRNLVLLKCDLHTGMTTVVETFLEACPFTLIGSLIRVPACQSPFSEATQLSLCRDTQHGIRRVNLVFLARNQFRLVQDSFSKLEGHEQTSIASCDLERFQVAYKFKGSVCVSTQEWSTLMNRLESESL